MAFNPGRHSTLAETLFPQSSAYFFLLSSFLHSLTPQSPVLVWGAASLSPAGLTCHISSLHYPLCPARRRGDRRGGGRAWSGSLPDLAPQGTGLALSFRGVRSHLAERHTMPQSEKGTRRPGAQLATLNLTLRLSQCSEGKSTGKCGARLDAPIFSPAIFSFKSCLT